MIKKLLLATAILSSSSAALASGAYLGASAGIVNTAFDIPDDTSLNANGVTPNFNIFGGYGSLVNSRIYLGGEVFANTTTGTVDIYSYYPFSANAKTIYTIGASFIPGYMITNSTMLYGRLGVAEAKYRFHGSAWGYSGDDDETTTGIQAGLGIQTSLNAKWDVRAEYVYSSYQDIDVSGITVSPTSNQVNFGLVYKFA